MHPLRALRERGHNTPEQVAALLAEDVVFHSPIFVRGIEGKDAVAKVFAASSGARSGVYAREVKLDPRTTFLHWKGEVGGRAIESFELIVDDANGLIVDRTVAFRPFPATAIFRSAVYPVLKDVVPADVWAYEGLPVSTELPMERAH